MKKVDENLYENALRNFEEFCDGFERAASESYLRGEQGTRIGDYTSKYRGDTPEVIREINSIGGESNEFGIPELDVSPSDCE
jgi:hypothetical protein